MRKRSEPIQMQTSRVLIPIGPRVMISFIISCSPETCPYSVTVALGYLSIAAHGTPKVEQVMHEPEGAGNEFGSKAHFPSIAWYWRHVSKGIPVGGKSSK